MQKFEYRDDIQHKRHEFLAWDSRSCQPIDALRTNPTPTARYSLDVAERTRVAASLRLKSRRKNRNYATYAARLAQSRSHHPTKKHRDIRSWRLTFAKVKKTADGCGQVRNRWASELGNKATTLASCVVAGRVADEPEEQTAKMLRVLVADTAGDVADR